MHAIGPKVNLAQNWSGHGLTGLITCYGPVITEHGKCTLKSAIILPVVKEVHSILLGVRAPLAPLPPLYYTLLADMEHRECTLKSAIILPVVKEVHSILLCVTAPLAPLTPFLYIHPPRHRECTLKSAIVLPVVEEVHSTLSVVGKAQ
jgi:hypothetical protein